MEPIGLIADLIREPQSKRLSFCITNRSDEIAGWPNLNGVRYIVAHLVLDTQQSVRGILELVNRIPTREHPFDTFDAHELIAAQNVAQTLGAAIDHCDQWQAAHELRSQLATSAQIGASSLSGAIVMHRLCASSAPFNALLIGSNYSKTVVQSSAFKSSGTSEKRARMQARLSMMPRNAAAL